VYFYKHNSHKAGGQRAGGPSYNCAKCDCGLCSINYTRDCLKLRPYGGIEILHYSARVTCLPRGLYVSLVLISFFIFKRSSEQSYLRIHLVNFGPVTSELSIREDVHPFVYLKKINL